ncbi:hypothetical protein AC251_23885 (plasmid) [Ralstonia pseudosolanacearum]|nr:hypothetical protein AC251_23885 [Ralstonia pseudosolanacearum]
MRVAQPCADLAPRLPRSNDAVQQFVLPFVSDQLEKTIPQVIWNIQYQSKAHQPETHNVVVQIHSPRMTGVLLLLRPN